MARSVSKTAVVLSTIFLCFNFIVDVDYIFFLNLLFPGKTNGITPYTATKSFFLPYSWFYLKLDILHIIVIIFYDEIVIIPVAVAFLLLSWWNLLRVGGKPAKSG